MLPSPSPLHTLPDERWAARGVELLIKRDDLLAPAPNDPFCGNKWRKLQHNLLRAQAQGATTLVSFGGAYSNHIAALASAGQHLGMATAGIIRGEAVSNPTLARAQAAGMHLHFVDRPTYRQLTATPTWQALEDLKIFPGLDQAGTYLIPEGGTNAAALPGCTALAREILQQTSHTPTHVAVACGTGGTLAGLIQGLDGSSLALGISVLKGHFMTDTVAALLQQYTGQTWPGWRVHETFHHCGYARSSPELAAFIQNFYDRHGILLEPIYTGKLFYALEQLLEAGFFPEGSRVVGIHTGGLQALASSLAK